MLASAVCASRRLSAAQPSSMASDTPFIIAYFGLAVVLIGVVLGISLTRLAEEDRAFHNSVFAALVATNLLMYALCSRTDPGTVTKKNQRIYAARYTYDGALFPSGVECQTCALVKPARSKHCGTLFSQFFY